MRYGAKLIMNNITPFKVSSARYSIHCDQNDVGHTHAASLVFDIDLAPDTGDEAWIEKALADIKGCLTSNSHKLSSDI